ncbi:hypothetical protein OSB04_021527 [Centaurea solstitialis]|uniref:Jacalin-type lectin domain-containing protein n=1 Tax=Centaurea solstitialis TaxID=347529 RepID=A0AA38SUC7_9ASTR|nr:hypothetical protein OSB04_021527 [Centaurea solstitialis]
MEEEVEDGKKFLGPLAEKKYEEDKLDEIIDPNLRKQMKLTSLNTFSTIAYHCLKSNRSERPTMARVVEKLENAFSLQASLKTAEIARVGVWGTKSSGAVVGMVETRFLRQCFSVPWENGKFGGFYGLAGYYIDAIGVYMKASSEEFEIARTGVWGSKSPGSPQNQWSFQLERNHHLKKITIDHGDLIYSLIFTTEYRGIEQPSDKAGGWNGGDKVSEVVTFAWDEEINAISGTVGVSGGYTIISSLSFITNKKTHGPYGRATGEPFTVPWDKGTFVGFYGRAGYYIDAIGVYLKATI